jgi:hypothetical protein
MEFKRANTYQAVFFFLFARKKYISLAVNHGMAVNLEDPDLRRRYQEGLFPPEGWERESSANAIEAAKQVSKGLWGSFLAILIVAVIASLAGYMKGTINLAFAFDHGKALSYVGTFFASWATLMELGGGLATFSGEALHELIHPTMFKLLFIPGVCLLLLGITL